MTQPMQTFAQYRPLTVAVRPSTRPLFYALAGHGISHAEAAERDLASAEAHLQRLAEALRHHTETGPARQRLAAIHDQLEALRNELNSAILAGEELAESTSN